MKLSPRLRNPDTPELVGELLHSRGAPVFLRCRTLQRLSGCQAEEVGRLWCDIANQSLTRVIAMPDGEKIIRLKAVIERTGLSRTTVYRKISEGTFPRQLRISAHSAGWHESAVSRWIDSPATYRSSDAG